MLLIWSLMAVMTAGKAFPKTIYVDKDARGANNGSSWKDAYNYLQDALADADSGDEPVERNPISQGPHLAKRLRNENPQKYGKMRTQIKVAQGVYKPDQKNNKTSSDRKATFQLLDFVTLKGGFAGLGQTDPNARNIALYETVLSGDLKGDDAAVNNPWDLQDEPSRNDNSYCVVTGSTTKRTAVLDGFTITAGSRHGMYNNRGNPTITNCTFRGNRAQRWGGGLCNKNGEPKLTRCTFIHNYAQYGGGIWNFSGSPVLIWCVFSENWATYGGGIYNYDYSRPRIINCTIRNNSARFGAGVYNNKKCSPRLINCTFAGNLAEGKGGSVHNICSSSPVLINCILWGNGPDEIADYVMSSSNVSYSHVGGGADEPWFGKGCIDGDPLFVGPNNLRLSPGSPCIDAGDNTAIPAEIATCLDEKPRIINGIVDMGAFERE